MRSKSQQNAILLRAKRISDAFKSPPAFPCGCRFVGAFCSCSRLCDCELDWRPCEDCGEGGDCELDEAGFWQRIKQAGAFLNDADPENYADRPIPARPRRCVSRDGRIATMQLRHDRGESLFHPDDVKADQLRDGQLCGYFSYAGAFFRAGPARGWQEDEPWWDDHLEETMNREATERDREKFPLFCVGAASQVPFADRSGAIQRRDVEDDEERVAGEVEVKARELVREALNLRLAAQAALRANQEVIAAELLRKEAKVRREINIRATGREDGMQQLEMRGAARATKRKRA